MQLPPPTLHHLVLSLLIPECKLFFCFPLFSSHLITFWFFPVSVWFQLLLKSSFPTSSTTLSSTARWGEPMSFKTPNKRSKTNVTSSRWKTWLLLLLNTASKFANLLISLKFECSFSSLLITLKCVYNEKINKRGTAFLLFKKKNVNIEFSDNVWICVSTLFSNINHVHVVVNCPTVYISDYHSL